MLDLLARQYRSTPLEGCIAARAADLAGERDAAQRRKVEQAEAERWALEASGRAKAEAAAKAEAERKGREAAEAKKASSASPGDSGAAVTDVLGSFADWQVHRTRGSKLICFSVSEPTIKQGGFSESTYFCVSAWPEDQVGEEISIKLGFRPRTDSEVAARVGPETFQLFTKGSKAFVADAGDEKRLVSAMRAGNTVTVEGTGEDGAQRTSIFSLKGLTAALGMMKADCVR